MNTKVYMIQLKNAVFRGKFIAMNVTVLKNRRNFKLITKPFTLRTYKRKSKLNQSKQREENNKVCSINK